MADVAAVLDTTGVAGLHVGKKGRKGATGGLDPASFLTTFLSQVAVAGGTKGKTSHAVGMIPSGGANEKTHSDKALMAEDSDAAESTQDGNADLIARLSLDKDGEHDVKITGDAVERGSSTTPHDAADSTTTPGNFGNPAVSVARMAAGNRDSEASMTSSDEAVGAVDVKQSKGERQESGGRVSGAGNRTASTAIAADKPDDKGQNLPVPGMERSALDASSLQPDVATKDVADVPSLVGSNGTSPSSDASVVRTFDQSMRQVESRVNLAVEAPVKSPAFAGELAEKVVWMAGRQGQVAELTLNPPHLGSVEIRLTVSGGEAGAQFFSANPSVRDAIEAAMPKLRELMAQAGLNLGDANVRDQAFNQERGEGSSGTRSASLSSEPEGTLSGMGNSAPRRIGVGLVDLYA